MEEITRISDFIVNSNEWRGIQRSIPRYKNVRFEMLVSFETLKKELGIEIEDALKAIERPENLLEEYFPHVCVEILIMGISVYVPPDPVKENQEQFFRRQKETVLKERGAFLKMEREGRLTNYEGRFVAILNGKVIGINEDEMSLIELLYKEYKNNPPPMYIAKVGEKERVVRMLSPRIKT